jgi:tetratricopeptide (TPR) repeat protein
MIRFETNSAASEARQREEKYYSAEFSLKELKFAYQFRIQNIESKSMCVLIRKNSEILPCLKVGDILEIKYYANSTRYPPEQQTTIISDITKDNQGRFKGHYLVSLKILEKLATPFGKTLSHRPSMKRWLKKGRQYYDSGEYKEAIEAYTNAVDLDPKFAPPYFNRGVVYGKLGNYQRALDDLKYAAKLGSLKAQNCLKANNIHW